MPQKNQFKRALHATKPVIFCYIPLGIAFGMLFDTMLGHWYLAPLMSLFVFAGAAQFISIPMIANHQALSTILLMTLMVNLRHLFYGISFVKKYQYPWYQQMYMIFGLTDESFSILSAEDKPHDAKFCFHVTWISHAYWIFGTIIGALAGLYTNVAIGTLKFTLCMLFTIMLVESMRESKRYMPFYTALIITTIMMLLSPAYYLILSLLVISMIFIGKYFFIGKKSQREKL